MDAPVHDIDWFGIGGTCCGTYRRAFPFIVTIVYGLAADHPRNRARTSRTERSPNGETILARPRRNHRPDRDDRLRLDRPRHAPSDRAPFRLRQIAHGGHRPVRCRQGAARRARHRLRQGACDQEELQGPAGPAAHRGRGTGILRQPFRRHLLARPDEAVPQARRALHRHGRRTLARLLLRQGRRQFLAHQLCAARDGPRGEAQEPRRHDGGFMLRCQSGHGVLVRQAGAGQSRQRHRASSTPNPRPPIATAGRS